ncbi:hypothetical protein C5167_008640 [Papaver somniferum]|uniref:Uncharacterized protein n=1 Tax=Papaver somniferum TaxID=3469 RepID=A0A4Y7JV43_PAPSO|nr:hypothetical protein C5167_008640 [Papaver somniferum]
MGRRNGIVINEDNNKGKDINDTWVEVEGEINNIPTTVAEEVLLEEEGENAPSLGENLVNITKATKMKEKEVNDLVCAETEQDINWDIFLPGNKRQEADTSMAKAEFSSESLSPTDIIEQKIQQNIQVHRERYKP